jgi:DNA-binding NarL/FixJ family response regulator
MRKTLRILFVDDDPGWLNSLKRRIRRSSPGWDVSFAEDGQTALNMMETQACDVVVTDLNMPGIRGDSLLTQIAEKYPETLRFILSASDASECKANSGMVAMEFIPKEMAASDLLFRIASGVAMRRFMRGRIVDRLADVVKRMRELPNLTMQIINPNATNKLEFPCVEISCPDLGLEFRTLLNSGQA